MQWKSGDSILYKVVTSWVWFFVLLTSYYVLKPLRDGLGTELSDQLAFWYLVTFTSMILTMTVYSRLVAWVDSRTLVLIVYEFFALCLLLFAFLIDDKFSSTWLTGAFFVWVSVFNLTSVALFWSVMTDVFRAEESKLWFGTIASGGSLGALIGSSLILILRDVGTINLLLISALLLQIPVALNYYLPRSRLTTSPSGEPSNAVRVDDPPRSSIVEGLLLIMRSKFLLLLCLYVIIGKFAATFIYNNLQLTMKAAELDQAVRTEYFATINAVVQIASMFLQGFAVAWITKFYGGRTLLILPGLILASIFSVLFFDDSLRMLLIAQALQAIAGYSFMTPGQNLLFTILSRQDRYTSKGFVDTVVFRFSDVVASQVCQSMSNLHASLSHLSIAMLPFIILWIAIAWSLGLRYDRTLLSIPLTDATPRKE